MKHIAIILALASLTGCKERLEEGAEIEKKRTVRKEGFVNVDGKLVPNPPAGISEMMVLVEGRWMREKDKGVTWHVSCGENGCKPKLGPGPKGK